LNEKEYQKLMDEFQKSTFALKKIMYYSEKISSGVYDVFTIDESKEFLPTISFI